MSGLQRWPKISFSENQLSEFVSVKCTFSMEEESLGLSSFKTACSANN